MAYLGIARNLAVEAVTGVAKWVGLYKFEAAVTGWTGAAPGFKLKKTAHGLGASGIVFVKAAGEGGAGAYWKTNTFLFFKEVNADEIEVSQTQTGSAAGFVKEEWTTEIKGTVELQLCAEVANDGTYKRVKTKWNREGEAAGAKALKGLQDDTEKHEIPAKENQLADAAGYFTTGENSGEGEVRVIEWFGKQEKVTASKTLSVNSTKFDFEGITS